MPLTQPVDVSALLAKAGGTMTGDLVLVDDLADADRQPIPRIHFETKGHRVRFKSGLYYASPSSTYANNAGVANQVRVSPFVVAKSTAFDRIGCEVQAAGGGTTVRLMIYADDGNGFPGVLVLDAGTIDSSTTGFKEITINQTLHGMYWIGAKPIGGTPTLRGLSSQNPLMQTLSDNSLTATNCFQKNDGVSTAVDPFDVTAAYTGTGYKVLLRAT